MKKLKDFVQKIEFKILFKNILLSIIILYTVLNIGFLTADFINYYSLMENDNLKRNLEHVEENIKVEQEQAQKELEHGEIDSDSYIIYTAKYPAATVLFQQIGMDLYEKLDVLEISIFSGFFVGISIYLFSKEKRIIKLIIKFIVLLSCIVLINFLYINTDLIPFYIEEFYSEEILYFITGIDILLIIIKCIQTVYTKRKLNRLINKEENNKV